MTISADQYGRDHSTISIKEFYLYDTWTGCYAARFFNGRIELINQPTKLNDIQFRDWLAHGFICDERWVIK